MTQAGKDELEDNEAKRKEKILAKTQHRDTDDSD